MPDQLTTVPEMDKPTCETCLHWDGGKHIGECRLAVVPGVLTPVTRCCDSCGEHPDVPAWIAAQKSSHVLTVERP